MPRRSIESTGGFLSADVTSKVLGEGASVSYSKADYAEGLKIFLNLEKEAGFYSNFWVTKRRFKEYHYVCSIMDICMSDSLNLKDVTRFIKAYKELGQFVLPDGVMINYLTEEEDEEIRARGDFQGEQESMEMISRLKSVCSKLELELSYKELVQLDRDWNEHLVFDLGYDDHKSHSDDALLVWVGDHLAK